MKVEGEISGLFALASWQLVSCPAARCHPPSDLSVVFFPFASQKPESVYLQTSVSTGIASQEVLLATEGNSVPPPPPLAHTVRPWKMSWGVNSSPRRTELMERSAVKWFPVWMRPECGVMLASSHDWHQSFLCFCTTTDQSVQRPLLSIRNQSACLSHVDQRHVFVGIWEENE